MFLRALPYSPICSLPAMPLTLSKAPSAHKAIKL